MQNKLQKFMQMLIQYHSDLVFNPWADYDSGYDISDLAPHIRAANLERYLALRLKAKYLFLAEALGYQGGHFSGMAMTSERILLGKHPQIKPEVVLGQWEYQRTSNPLAQGLSAKVREEGFNEPTATVMWGELARHQLSPRQAILWNIFPFHPYKKSGLLTNRTPTTEELDEGVLYTKFLLQLIPGLQIISIGQKSQLTLKRYGIECQAVRHPSMGGASEFRVALQRLFPE